jgi:putative endonuclease
MRPQCSKLHSASSTSYDRLARGIGIGIFVIPTEVEGSRAVCGAQAITSASHPRPSAVLVYSGYDPDGPMRQFYVYILSSRSGVLYVGVTSDLQRRMYEHKHGLIEGFTRTYAIKRLIYYEQFDEPLTAIEREMSLPRIRGHSG